MPTDEVEKAVRRYKRPPGVEYDPRRGKEVYRPKDPAKVAKAEKLRLEAREDDKAMWDRVERVVERVFAPLVSPEALKVYAGAALGGIALYPQEIVLEEDFKDVQLVGTGTPPEQKRIAEGHCKDAWEARKREIETEHNRCYEACVRGGGTPDKIQRCQEGCDRVYYANLRQADSVYFKCVDRAGTWTTTGALYTFHYKCSVLAYVHTLIPDITIEAFGQTVSTRDAFRFTFKKISAPITVMADPILDEMIENARVRAKAQVTAEIKRDFLLLGIGAGASGPFIAEMLRTAAEALKGVGEIVPG